MKHLPTNMNQSKGYPRCVLSHSLFDGAGSLRPDYERVDWAATSLGPVSSWAPSLRGTLSLALATRFPVTLLWGPDLVLLYNEAYVPLIGDKHPAALGVAAEVVFPEVWESIAPMLKGVLAGAGPTWVEDIRLLLARRGFLEECFFTFSYSPVAGEDVAVAGVLDIVAETTSRVVDRRRLELLTQLSDLLSDLHSPSQVPDGALSLLRTASLDLPVVDIVLPGGTPGGPGSERLPPVPPPGLLVRETVVQETPQGRVAWLRLPGTHAPSTRPVLAVLLSEHLAPDQTYLSFLGLVAAAIANALSVTGAHEREQQKADIAAKHAARLASLVDVAQALPDAHSEVEVLEVIVSRSAALLQAYRVVLGLLEPTGERLRLLTLEQLPVRVRGGVPLADAPSTLVEAVRGNVRIFRDQSLGHVGDAAAVLPLRVGEQVVGALSLHWKGPRPFTEGDRAVLTALAASTAQALDRVRAWEAEQQAAGAVRSMAAALQRSLLTRPPQPPHLDIAVRYQPAARQAEIGGDWYDAFATPDGATVLVVGDVTDHDQNAAAAMGQVRNLLRATAFAAPDTPAAVFSALERAMSGLEVDTLATAVLAQVRPGPDPGSYQIDWCNAGHPPPLLRQPDGTVRILQAPEPDLLLGLQTGNSRTDSTTVLLAQATLLLYTDGLIERRGESLHTGQQRLADAFADLGALPLEQLCDLLLERVLPGEREDDVVLLAVRLRPQLP